MANTQKPSFFQNEIMTLANQGQRPIEIAKVLNLVPVSVSQFLNRKGVYYHHKQPVDSNYFSVIDKPLKAYFIGLIAADGYIVKHKSTVFGIQLNIIDIEVIELLKSELKTTLPILFTKNGMARLVIGDQQIVKDLYKLGITTNKSLTLQNIILNIPFEYRDAFIAGYLDGDGCFVVPKFSPHTKKYKGLRKRPSKGYSCLLIISFRGTKELLSGIINHLGYVNYNLYFNKTWILTIHNIKNNSDFIHRYKESPYKFPRKYNKIKHLFDYTEYKQKQVQTISSS
jgi:hypothetical protein